MKLIVSPAKSLNQKDQLPTDQYTQPVFEDLAAQVNRKLARMTKDEIADLMSISDKLADLNYGRYQDFKEQHTPENSRPAIYMFDGDVYSGIDAYSIPKDKIENLQNSLRILSGMYGVLRPLDLIQPYRLEMGTKLPIESNNDLYELWQEKVTAQLNSELKEDELFINLASQEYFKAVDSKKLNAKIISPVFKDFKNGKLKIISFYAKKARGLMVRYILDHDVETLDGLKGFDYENYHYSEEHTEKDDEPVFIR
ncbi:peroxide stress protein YaaA [Psychroflexus montanilacus]|uniref:peroxide stress protein YaaA n=1 Tax=Psychroflexus montanilacus TaxID=2873598 RepID=UPI001CCA5588|nr:peroxide stress protein YaaA [Psychroflexus montanilacus]MBZ9650825.1 peroxide stress protein YaaA [Psychroflexus montanilacus]